MHTPTLLAALALAFPVALSGPLAARPAAHRAALRDWSAAVGQTPAGAYVLGNPAARVKLVEYGSYTCSHCAAFATESDPVLRRQLIRSGSTSWEFRHMIRDPFDLAAAVVARCAGPRGFEAVSQAIFAGQPQWLAQAQAYIQANAAQLQGQPPLRQLRAFADGAGLSAIGRAHGVTPAQLDACFADKPAIDRITAMTAAAPAEVTGTPAFFVNGRAIPGADWARLEPVLRDAGAR